MVADKSIKVFLSYSFDTADEGVIQTILKVFNLKRFRQRIKIVTARDLAEQGLLDQIAECIETCDVTLAVFTKRFETKVSNGENVS